MRAVNLLPDDLRLARSGPAAGSASPTRVLQISGVVAVVVAVLLVGLFVIERSHVHSKQKELAHDQARIVAVQARVNAVKQAQDQAAARLAVVKTIVGSRMDWDAAMNDFARILPKNVFLSSMQATAPVTASSLSVATAAGATASSTLSISGKAPTHPDVATVLDKLALLPWLSNVTLVSTSRQSDGTISFAVTATTGEVH